MLILQDADCEQQGQREVPLPELRQDGDAPLRALPHHRGDILLPRVRVLRAELMPTCRSIAEFGHIIITAKTFTFINAKRSLR
jgi:hypothetical protein